jgi:radical SAM protein with 4Fe4S-binding SPASM domain
MLPVSDLLEVARNRMSGVEAGVRAPQRFSPSGSHAPVVVWNVCIHCNMTCPHCYAAAASQPSPKDLSHAEALRVLEEMAACGVRVVVFSGGEPLLRADLFDLLSRAGELGIAAQLSTNGTGIDAAVARRLVEVGVQYVGISIDGVPAFNDAYRGLEGGSAAAVEGLRHAKAAGLRTGLRMTLSRRNVDQIGAMLDLATEVSADRFYVSHLLYSGRGFRIASEDLTRGEARAALLDLFERAAALLEREGAPRIVTGSNDSDGPLLLRWIEARYGERAVSAVEQLLRERGGNSAGEKILNIDHQGRVHPDQFWRAAVLGDLRKEGFAAILAHPMRELLRNRLDHLKGRCGACGYAAICRGSHRERALAHARDMWAPDPACVMEDSEIGVGAREVAFGAAGGTS